MNFSFPTARWMVKQIVFYPLSSQTLVNSAKVCSSSAGNLRSDLRSPLGRITETKPSSSISATSSSSLVTLGVYAVAAVGPVSSYFLLVKMSIPTTVALAEPCFPGLAVEYSVTLQGKPLSMQQPPFLTSPKVMGVQSADPESPFSKVFQSSDIVDSNNYVGKKINSFINTPNSLIKEKRWVMWDAFGKEGEARVRRKDGFWGILVFLGKMYCGVCMANDEILLRSCSGTKLTSIHSHFPLFHSFLQHSDHTLLNALSSISPPTTPRSTKTASFTLRTVWSFLPQNSNKKYLQLSPPKRQPVAPFNMVRYNINSLITIADMQLVRVKIETLLELTGLRQTDHPSTSSLPHPIYPHCKTLLKILNETAQSLAHLTIKSRQQLLGRDQSNSQLLCSREDIAIIDAIKREIEEMRYRLSTPNCDTTALLPQMRQELKQLLKMCIQCQEKLHYDRERQEMKIRVDPPRTEMSHGREPESDRTAKLKKELALQLEKHLQNRRKDSKQYVHFGNTAELNKRDHFLTQTPSFSNKNTAKNEMNESGAQLQGRTKRKKYNYLQQCERQIQKIRVYEYSTSPQGAFTPKIEKEGVNIALLSTKESHSDPLGDQLELIMPHDPQQGCAIFTDFDHFSQEDSIQRDRIRAENLEDSLQLMKQEQDINRTAFFGIAVTDRQQQANFGEGGHNYSFSHDI